MYNHLKLRQRLLLPQTEQQFEDLVDVLVKRYKLPDPTHCAVVLANQIQRLPADECYSTLEYLGKSILKSVAYAVALHKSRVLSHKAQIDHIASLLKDNPHDQQALDALEAASKEGSVYAKEILSLYRPVDAGDNVVKMNPLLNETETQGSTV